MHFDVEIGPTKGPAKGDVLGHTVFLTIQNLSDRGTDEKGTRNWASGCGIMAASRETLWQFDCMCVEGNLRA